MSTTPILFWQKFKKKAINLKTSILHLDLKCLQTPCMSQELLIFPTSFIQDIYSKKSSRKVRNWKTSSSSHQESPLIPFFKNDCAPYPQPFSGPCGVIRNTAAKCLVSKIKPYSHLALFSCKLMIEIRSQKPPPLQPSLLKMWRDLEFNILIPFIIAILSRRIIGFEFCVGELVRAGDLQCLNLATDAIKDFMTQRLKIAASVSCTGLRTCRHLPNKSKPFPLVCKVNSTNDLWTGSQDTAQVTFEQLYSFLTSPSLLLICNVL